MTLKWFVKKSIRHSDTFEFWVYPGSNEKPILKDELFVVKYVTVRNGYSSINIPVSFGTLNLSMKYSHLQRNS